MMHRPGPNPDAHSSPSRGPTTVLPAALVLAALAAASLTPPACGDEAPSNEATAERSGWHTGRPLTRELARPVNIVLRRTTPRQVVLRLRELHRIALWLDRRIDPDQPIDVQFAQVSLLEALQTFAEQLDAQVAQVGGTLFIGLPESTDRIRTVIELRTAELRRFEGEDAVGRQFTLLRGTTLAWPDLAEPAQLVADVCQTFQIEQNGKARVPHDLWAAGAMADVNAVEALSLLLGQFDLTFTWQQQAAAMSIGSMPPAVTVRREHTSRQQDIAGALTRLREQFPHLEPVVSGRSFTLEATVGEHEAIAAFLNPMPATAMPPESSLGPLARRRFTLKAMRAEAIAVLRTLQAQDVTIEYDPAALRQAGVDLQQMITLNLDKATADELFRQICEPLGLGYEIEDNTVRLSPAP